MIEYGIALLVVCILLLFDKRALPYALTLSGGWLLGFGPVEAWPAISLGISGITLLLYRRDPTWCGGLIHSIAVAMMLMDVLYWATLVQGTYIGVGYAYSLNVGLAVQLILVGHKGAISGWSSLLDWCGSRLRRPAVHGGCHAREA